MSNLIAWAELDDGGNVNPDGIYNCVVMETGLQLDPSLLLIISMFAVMLFALPTGDSLELILRITFGGFTVHAVDRSTSISSVSSDPVIIVVFVRAEICDEIASTLTVRLYDPSYV